MKFATLNEWLNWQESLNPKEIDLGLERVRAVWQRLPQFSEKTTIITIAGTNGKGSTVAFLESILDAAGYATGSYTSPHLLHYNERIRLQSQSASDEKIMQAFESIEQARKDIPLTYFEYGTLAALVIFVQENVDVVLLEVGLGGRLDAVNIVDANAAIITSIGLDHQAWLGDDRETIGREKAGIFRTNQVAVFSGKEIPQSILDYAQELTTNLAVFAQDYDYEIAGDGWQLRNQQQIWQDLPLPALDGAHQLRNLAGVLVLLNALGSRLSVSREAINLGVQQVQIKGRQQYISGSVSWLLDVAHNPHAVTVLRDKLQSLEVSGKVWAVLGMLNDKDAPQVFNLMSDLVDYWCLVNLDSPRSMPGAALEQTARSLDSGLDTQVFSSVSKALKDIVARATEGDLILIFGSFHTVGETMLWLGYNH